LSGAGRPPPVRARLVYNWPVASSRRILVVDDESDNRALMRRVFAGEYEIIEAADGEHALALLDSAVPQVVIADQRLPGICGVEVLTRVKHLVPSAIRILVTAFAEYSALVEAVNEAEVHYYLEKPFQTLNLRSMVSALVEKRVLEEERSALLERLRVSEANLQQLVEERTRQLAEANAKLSQSNEALKQMVVRDGLTGVHNHRYLLEYMEMEIARSSRYGREFGVLFLDIDNFKLVNDTHGHQSGDDVLCRVAELLSGPKLHLRKSDFAARYGGEEFVVLLPETDIRGAQIKGERIRAAVEQIPFAHGTVTVSIGVAVYPRHGRTTDALIHSADKALYTAKRAGKNQVVLAG
jgi:diguanylate cyclase (GGDEF)-like protein